MFNALDSLQNAKAEEYFFQEGHQLTYRIRIQIYLRRNSCQRCVYIYIYIYRDTHIYTHTHIYIYIYTHTICIQQLFRSLRAHQHSSDQMKILKDQSAGTTARVMSVAYPLWLPFLINRVLNITKLRSVT